MHDYSRTVLFNWFQKLFTDLPHLNTTTTYQLKPFNFGALTLEHS